MAGYEVVLAAMAHSAASARSAADQMAAVDLAGTLEGVEQAMPGARSLGKVGQVRQAWQGRTQQLAGELRDHAQGIDASKRGYEANEESAKRDLHAVDPRAGRRPV